MEKKYIAEILDEREKLEVQKFVQNEAMYDAVKKVLLAGLYTNGTLKIGKDPNPRANAAYALVAYKKEMQLSNEQIGADLTALWEGLNALEAGYEALKTFVPKTEGKAETGNQGK